MRALAYVSFAVAGLLILAMFVLFGLGVWFNEGRIGGLGFLALIAVAVMFLVGAFFASQAGMGVKK